MPFFQPLDDEKSSCKTCITCICFTSFACPELMRLTLQTDFALRTLLYLATIGRRSTVAEVAGLFGISANHVAKVVNQLARLGYVRSVRGIGGGIELARPAEEIRLGEVIRDFEG